MVVFILFYFIVFGQHNIQAITNDLHIYNEI